MRGKFRVLFLLSVLAFVGSIPAKAQTPGQSFRDCIECPEMVVVPAGTFRMGPVDGEHDWAVKQGGKPEWYTDENPRHEVRIPRSFSIGKYEVTRRQCAAFVRATGNCYTKQGEEWKPDLSKDWRGPGLNKPTAIRWSACRGTRRGPTSVG